MTSNQINHYLKDVFEKYGIWELAKQHKFIVAGGCIAELLRMDHEAFAERDYKIKGDIDVYVPAYLPSDQTFADIKTRVSSKFNIPFHEVSNLTTSLQTKIVPRNGLPELNIIYCRNYNGELIESRHLLSDNLIDLIKRFDLTCVKCGAIMGYDSFEIYVDPNYIDDIYGRVAKVSKEGIKLNPVHGILARLYKYKLKGFLISESNEGSIKLKCSLQNIPLNEIIELKQPGEINKEDYWRMYAIGSPTITEFYNKFQGQTIKEALNYIIYG